MKRMCAKAICKTEALKAEGALFAKIYPDKDSETDGIGTCGLQSKFRGVPVEMHMRLRAIVYRTAKSFQYTSEVGRIAACPKCGKQIKGYAEGTFIPRIISKAVRRNNTSGCRGVYFDKESGMWRAVICGKQRDFFASCVNLRNGIE